MTPRSAARLTREPIDVAGLAGVDRNDGALCLFVGVVRDDAARPVSHLEYEAYEEMALPLLETVAQEALAGGGVTRVEIVHRLGTLRVGEASVAVAVSAPHRGPAFEACRRAIDAIKDRVPIWKKECGAQGARWVPEAR